MNRQVNAKKIGYLDPTATLKKINSIPTQIWQADQFRSTLRGLEKTESILVQYDSQNPLNISENIEIRFRELYEVLNPAIEYIRTQVPEKKLIRLFIAKLPSKSKIGIHVDPEEYSKLVRYHWALQTNEYCKMVFRRESFHFKSGEIWFFNNLVHHGVSNDGENDRLHAIFDFQRIDFEQGKN